MKLTWSHCSWSHSLHFLHSSSTSASRDSPAFLRYLDLPNAPLRLRFSSSASASWCWPKDSPGARHAILWPASQRSEAAMCRCSNARASSGYLHSSNSHYSADGCPMLTRDAGSAREMPWSGSIRRDQAGLPPAPRAVVDVRARPVLRRPGIRPFAAHERVVAVQHSPMRRAGICAQRTGQSVHGYKSKYQGTQDCRARLYRALCVQDCRARLRDDRTGKGGGGSGGIHHDQHRFRRPILRLKRLDKACGRPCPKFRLKWPNFI